MYLEKKQGKVSTGDSQSAQDLVEKVEKCPSEGAPSEQTPETEFKNKTGSLQVN